MCDFSYHRPRIHDMRRATSELMPGVLAHHADGMPYLSELTDVQW
jgi:hypothetical protein